MLGQHKLKPLASEIYATTGQFKDAIAKSAKEVDQMALYFYMSHTEEYKAAIHNRNVHSR